MLTLVKVLHWIFVVIVAITSPLTCLTLQTNLGRTWQANIIRIALLYAFVSVIWAIFRAIFRPIFASAEAARNDDSKW